MPHSKAPWQQHPPPNRSGNGPRLFLWVALLAAIGFGLWKLSEAFPGGIWSDLDKAQLLQLIVILVFVSSGLIFARQFKVREIVRNLLIWSGIMAVLILGFTFQDELRAVALRIRSEFAPGYPVVTDSNALVFSESADGHFYVIGNVNGAPIRFLVDTGASDIVLSPSDAARVGIDAKSLNFSKVYQTANGIGRGAPFTLASLSIGPIQLSNVPVSINQSEMSASLLGMSFLRSFASFEIQGRQLFLRPR